MATTLTLEPQVDSPQQMEAPRPYPAQNRLRRLAIPVLLLSIYAALSIWFIGTQSLTYDEPVHMSAGLDAWELDVFQPSEHPPLARVWMTIPFAPYRFQPGAFIKDPQGLAWRIRLPILVFGLMLGALVWAMCQRMWSESAANFALALFAFSPGLIAHFSLGTTDGAGVLMIFATAFQLVRWRQNPSRTETLGLGIILGLLLLSKMYAPPYALLTLGLVLILKPDRIAFSPRRWNWKPAACMAVVAFVVLWGGYHFHVSRVSVHNGRMTYPVKYVGDVPVMRMPPFWEGRSFFVPATEYFSGVLTLFRHSERGHGQSYLMGQVGPKGRLTYFPTVILLKWPTIVLLMAAAAAIVLFRKRLKIPFSFWIILLFPALAIGLGLASNINIGDRHILPAYPFLLVIAAAAWHAARSRAGSPLAGNSWKRQAATVLLLSAVALNAADAFRYAPDFLSYFNVFIPPRDAYKYLSDSNLDWGQGLIALREYQDQHPDEKLHLAYFGSVPPAWYGINAEKMKAGDRPTGTVVVSATRLAGQYQRDPTAFHWVLQYPLKTVLNHTLYVFEVLRPAN
ncbi:MAG: glycosyltransferase family 39 protein [Terriglobales bacterium]